MHQALPGSTLNTMCTCQTGLYKLSETPVKPCVLKMPLFKDRDANLKAQSQV